MLIAATAVMRLIAFPLLQRLGRWFKSVDTVLEALERTMCFVEDWMPRSEPSRFLFCWFWRPQAPLCFVSLSRSFPALVRAARDEIEVAHLGCSEIACRAEAAARVNPLKPDEATIAAGAAMFQQKLRGLSKFDGSGHTDHRRASHPRVPALRELIPVLTTVRSSPTSTTASEHGDAAWDLPESRNLADRRIPPPLAAVSLSGLATTRPPHRHWRPLRWLGACESCHKGSLRRWKQTEWPMSCAIRMSIPTRSIPDFSKPDPR